MKIVDLLKSLKNSIFQKRLTDGNLNRIIDTMPEGLSKLEKAYYIYIELGKLANENPRFVFGDSKEKLEHYDDEMDEDYYGICKTIAEKYVRLLKNPKVGVKARLVKVCPESKLTHVDALLEIDGKRYLTNLISDLYRIKSSKKFNSFGFDLLRPSGNFQVDLGRLEYHKRLTKEYGEISFLTGKEKAELDKKLGYPRAEQDFYTEDTFSILARDMKNSETVKKYLLDGKEVPESEILKRKLDFIFAHVNELTTYNGEMKYLERIRFFQNIFHRVLSPEENERIQSVAGIRNDDYSNIISILRVVPESKTTQKNIKESIYYVYSPEEKKYVEKSSMEMQEYFNEVKNGTLKIVGSFDVRKPMDYEDLCH